MRINLRNLGAILAVILLNGFGLVGHASAMPMHEMGGMSHDSSSSANCATLCRTAVFEKDEAKDRKTQVENDDDTTIPHYVQLHAGIFAYKPTKDNLYAVSVRPPPKIPIYILYSVFRV